MEYNWRVPVADDYVAAIGRAVYNFAYLEQGIIGLADKLSPEGFTERACGLTAGCIGVAFEGLANGLDMDHPARDRLVRLATTFRDLTREKRDKLVHGQPCTAESEQQLRYRGKGIIRDWTCEGVIDAARAFQEAAIEANDLFHKYFAKGS